MAKEQDQTGQLGTSVPEGPCVGCARRHACLVRFAYGILAELERTDLKQVHLLSSCSGFIPAPDADTARQDIRPELENAGIVHLCADCPETGVCGPHQTLEQLRELAVKNGLTVTFATVSCITLPARPRRRLLQILEPTITEEE